MKEIEIAASEAGAGKIGPVGEAEQPQKGWRPVLLMLLVVLSWASATVASKHLYLNHLITPLTLVVCRFSLASLFSLVFFSLIHKRNGGGKLPLVGSWRAYLLGGALICTFIVGFNLALLYITATLGGLVFFGVTPVVMLVAGHFLFGARLGHWQIIGMTIALLGLVVVISGGDVAHLLTALTGSNLPLGLGIMLVAAVGWGGFSLWGRRYNSLQPGASLLSTGINELIGVAPAWVLLFFLEPNGFSSLGLEAWLYILYIGIVPSSLGFTLFYIILKDLSLNQSATIQLFTPVFTAVMAIVFLGEPFSLALVIGTVGLLWGVRVTGRGKIPNSRV